MTVCVYFLVCIYFLMNIGCLIWEWVWETNNMGNSRFKSPEYWYLWIIFLLIGSPSWLYVYIKQNYKLVFPLQRKVFKHHARKEYYFAELVFESDKFTTARNVYSALLREIDNLDHIICSGELDELNTEYYRGLRDGLINAEYVMEEWDFNTPCL